MPFVHNDIPCFFDVTKSLDNTENYVFGELVLRIKYPACHYLISGSCPESMHNMRVHLGRQIVFELIITIDMACMLTCIMNVDNVNSLINEATRSFSNDIVCTVVGLYIGSLVLKLAYYSLHPWPLYAPNWGRFFCSDIAHNVYTAIGIGVALLLVLALLGALLYGFQKDSGEFLGSLNG